jgi:hypothetical protein
VFGVCWCCFFRRYCLEENHSKNEKKKEERERELWHLVILLHFDCRNFLKEPKIIFIFYLFEFVGVRVCGFAKKIVLHSVQSTSNAVVVEYYYYFVLERGGYFWQLKNKI